MLRSPYSDDLVADGLHVVVVPIGGDGAGALDAFAGENTLELFDDAGALPVVVIGLADAEARPTRAPTVFDLVLDDTIALERTLATIERSPVASVSLAVLLRGSSRLPVEHALAAESAVYSMLQAGHEAISWRAANECALPPLSTEPAVVATREDDVLHIALNRPQRHNAFSRDLRDGLCEMLALAVSDETITSVVLSGNGPSFCSGGDLGEFGTFGDPAAAHPTRLARSAARLMHRLAPRLRVHLHGACMGAGIELAAFAAGVVAHPDSSIALPEIGLGLVPGAGGTASITRRVGRQRCAELALGGVAISASTALSWGLIDSISPTRAAAWRP